MRLTKLVKHLITFIKDKVLQMLEIKRLVANQSQDPSRSSNDNVGAIVFQSCFIFCNSHPSKEHSNLDPIHVFAEPLIFLADLEGQFSGVTHDKHGNLFVHNFQLLKSSKNKDCRLAHSRLGLAHYIKPQYGLRDALVLH